MCGQLMTVIEKLRILRDVVGIPDSEYWEQLDRPGCTKWQYYKDHIHFADAFIRLGHYSSFDRERKQWDMLPLLSLEVNPNKHSEKLWFKKLMELIREWCCSGHLRKVDYAVDIPVAPGKVQIFQSRKERGLHKGTRYFGQRNKHGYCKIYDKQKEQELDYPLTRVEHTVRVDEPISLESVMLLDEKTLKIENTSELNGTDLFIVESIRRMRANGIECDDIVQKLGRKKMEKLEKHITGDYVPLDYGDYYNDLLIGIRELFYIDDTSSDIITDSEGFLQVASDFEF